MFGVDDKWRRGIAQTAGLPKVDGDKLGVQTGIGIPPLSAACKKRVKSKDAKPSKERRQIKGQ